MNTNNTNNKGKKKTTEELLREQNAWLKNALCKCPHDGRYINCPIHGWNTNFIRYEN